MGDYITKKNLVKKPEYITKKKKEYITKKKKEYITKKKKVKKQDKFQEDFVDNIIEDVGKKADIIFKKSVQKKSSPHMSVDQIADRADKEVGAYLKKVTLGTTHKDYNNKYKKKLKYK